MKTSRTLLVLVALFAMIQSNIAQSVVKTYYDPYTKTKLHEVYQVIPNTPTLNGSYKEYFEDGLLKQEGYYTKGEKNGVFKYYNGKYNYGLETFKNGVVEGLCETYYLSHPFTIEKSWIVKNKSIIQTTEWHLNGVKGAYIPNNGLCTYWSESGKKIKEYYSKEGVIDGEYKEWFESNQIKATATYKMGIPTGKSIFYHSDGKIQTETEYNIEGDPIYEKHFSINEKLIYTDSLVSSELKVFHKVKFDSIKGHKIMEYDYYFEGNKEINDGMGLIYYPDGSIKYKMNYKKGARHGDWKIYYDENWKEVFDFNKCSYYREINYNNGSPNGIVKDYYKTGELQSEFMLRSTNPDVYNGVVKVYYKSGKLQVLNNYNDVGGVVGANINYYESGIVSDSSYYFTSEEKLDAKCKICIKYYLQKDSLGNTIKVMKFVNPYSIIQNYKRLFITGKDAYELEEYHKNGKTKFKAIAFYNSSDEFKYTGVAEYFDETGNLLKKENYDSDGNLQK